MKEKGKKKVKNKEVSNEDLAHLIDSLARATAKGFNNVQDKFSKIEDTANKRFKLIIDRFERVEDDVTDIKRALGPLVQVMALGDKEMSEVKLRLTRVERKVGLTK